MHRTLAFPDRRRPSPSLRRVGSRNTLFEACSAFTRVPARLLAKPPNGGPFTPECFSLHRYLRKPLWLLPTEATRVGWDSHPLGKRAFPRRTETAKVVILSVTEGDDKPLKYPDMFAAADLMIVSKTDLLPHVDFDIDKVVERARRLNPGLACHTLSGRRGHGVLA